MCIWEIEQATLAKTTIDAMLSFSADAFISLVVQSSS
jgi:hypothetical protein